MKTIRVDEESLDRLLVEEIKDTLEYSIDFINSVDMVNGIGGGVYNNVEEDVEYHYNLINSCKGVLRHYMYIGDYEEYVNGLKIIASRKS